MSYRFADCVFDPADGELRRAGRPVPLRPVTARILVCLLHRRGGTVSKQELFEQVWPGRMICDATLNTSLKELRRAIGDDGHAQMLIKTVRGRGYRFVAPVALSRETPAGSAAPLVGRRREWRVLGRVWRQAERGRSGLLLITGEAGIGKSRLAAEFCARRAAHGAAVADAVAIEGGSAFAPLAQWLRAEAVAPGLAVLDPVWTGELARLLPELGEPAAALSQGWQRTRFFQAAVRALLAAGRPLLLWLDDLHWCDRDTLEWLHYLPGCESRARLLVIATARAVDLDRRPGLRSLPEAWHRQARLTRVELPPLAGREAAALVTAVLGRPPAPKRLRQLLELAVGHPFYLIELSRLRAGASLPRQIRELVAGRLAGLDDSAVGLCRLAAVLGRACDADTLARLCGRPVRELAPALEALYRRRLLLVRHDGHYAFAHALVREAIYQELNPVALQQLHRQIAGRLAGRNGPAVNAAELAYHNLRAGRRLRAAHCYRQAAAAARAVSAFAEEAGALEKALAALEPEAGVESLRIELYLDLGLARSAALGWGNPAVGRAWRSAFALAMRSGGVFQRGRAVNALDTYYRDIGRWDRCRELAATATALDAQLHDPYLKLCLLCNRGALLLHLGEPERGLRCYDDILEVDHEAIEPSFNWFNRTHLIGAYFRSAQCLWLLGYPERACCRAEQALSLARCRSDPFHLAITLFHVTMVYEFCRDDDRVAALADELLTLATACEFPFYVYAAKLYRGGVLVRRGQPERGLRLITRNTACIRSHGTRMFEPYWRAGLAEARLAGGGVVAALDEVDRTLAVTARTANRYWDAQLGLLRGDCLLRCGRAAAAERAYLDAAEAARRQRARSLELRAALALCALRQQRGAARRARSRLETLCHRFVEGSAGADLRRARRLLGRPVGAGGA